MATYAVTEGVSAWSTDPLTDETTATAYATARGWADWLAATEAARDAAILEASTWVRATKTPPDEYEEAVDAVIGNAVIEASRLALSGALMGGNAAGSGIRTQVRAGSVSVSYAARSYTSSRNDRLALVSALLRSVGVGGGSSINHALRKA